MALPAGKPRVFFSERRKIPFEQRFDRIEAKVQTLQRSRLRWRHAFIASVIVILIGAASTWAAFTAQNDTFEGLHGNTISYDESKFSVLVIGHLVSLGEAAAGTTFGSPAAFTSGVSDVARESSSLGDWYYIIEVDEAGVDTVPAQTTTAYRAELFLDGTSQGYLYFKQTTAETGAVEDVQLKWNLGASLSATTSYVLKIQEVSS